MPKAPSPTKTWQISPPHDELAAFKLGSPNAAFSSWNPKAGCRIRARLWYSRVVLSQDEANAFPVSGQGNPVASVSEEELKKLVSPK